MATTPSQSAGGNTTTNGQWNPGATTIQTVTFEGLDPAANYILLVRAELLNGDGTLNVSDWGSVPLAANNQDASGTNIIQVNKGTDVRLDGGALYATSDTDPLPKNLGAIDVTTATVPFGSGIIFNKTGIAAFKSQESGNSVPEFILNASDGTAKFQGLVQAGTLKIGPKVDPTGTKNGVYINEFNYWYDDGTFVTSQENINDVVTGKNAKKPAQPTTLVASWIGQDLRISFNFDVTAKGDTYDNTHVKDFVVGFKTLGNVVKFLKVVPDDTIAQAYLLTFTNNRALFGIPQSEFAEITVIAEDIYGNQSDAASTSATGGGGYQLTLPTPTVQVSNSNNGYTVSFTNYPSLSTYPTFAGIIVEEYVSTSATDPGNVTYTKVSADGSTLNPYVMITPNTSQRWVRARYIDTFGKTTSPSAAVKANPVNPVAAGLDLVPPNEVTIGTISWNAKDGIDIHYSLPATEPGVRFVISLTTNYAPYDSPSFTGFFYKYADGTGVTTITADELFQQFGASYTSFNGLFKSADQADNRSSGVNFTVPVKVSYLNGTNVDLNTIGITPIPGGYIVLPPINFPTGAGSLEVWQSTLSSGTYSLVAASTTLMALQLPDLNTYYVKIRYTGASGDFTNYSTVVSITATNPGSIVTPTPATPSFGLVTADQKSITIGMDPSDTITKGYYVKYYPDGNTDATKIDMVPTSGSGTTSYTLLSLIPSKIYKIQIAAYNDSAVLSSYTSLQSLSTTGVTVSPPTNVVFSAKAFGGLVSWSTPSTPPTQINSYGISIYNSITGALLISNEITYGTTHSVSGLKGSTSYYAKVYSIDVFGNTSTLVQSNTITLNNSGGISDLLFPATSPSPVVKPLFGALQVTWDLVTNADPVTYEVHVSTTSGFTPSTTTKAIETQGSFAVIKTLPLDGSLLVYGTTYYVKIVAKDTDGANPGPYTQASAITAQIDNGDIAANAVRANTIQSGSISSDKVDAANLLVSKLFSVGSGGTYAIKIDATGDGTTSPYKLYSGAGSYSDSGTAFYLDSVGKFSLKNKLYFDGASTLTVNGNIIAQGGYFNSAVNINGYNGAMKLGRLVNPAGTLDGLYIDANNYWYSTGLFKLGSSGLGLSWDGTTFRVTGELHISSNSTFDDIVQIVTSSNGALLVGDSKTTGPRVVIDKNGIYAYDNNATSNSLPTTSINLAVTSGLATFNTNNATIGGWKITPGYIESNSGANYYGISSTGTYSFYAGSAQGGASSAKFSVTKAGVLTAKEIYIVGTGSAGTKLIDAGSFYVNQDGTLYAPQATITGTINASTGTFSGNVSIATAGSLYSAAAIILPGATGNPNTYPIIAPGNAGYILNKNGLSFTDGSSTNTSILSDGTVTANKGTVGGWTIAPTGISQGNITLNPNVYNNLGAITVTRGIYTVGMTPPTTDTASTDVVLWAGSQASGQTAYQSRTSANFQVLADGTFIATKGAIGESVTIGAGGATLLAIKNGAAAGAAAPKTFRTGTQPATTGVPDGSIWFDTSNSNKPYILVSSTWTLTSLDKLGIGLGSVENYSAADQTKNGLESGTTITQGGITLSSGGSIKGGQSDYNTGTGFFLGYSGTNYKFSIGNSTNYLTWDGSTLTAAGTITASAISASALVGATYKTSSTADTAGGIIINTSGIHVYNTSGTEAITLDSSGLSSTQFSISRNGNATFSGKVTAATINVTGETLVNTGFDADSGGGTGNSGSSNAFSSTYVRTSLFGTQVTSLGMNAVALISTSTAGVVSSWYPYQDGGSDLGVKYSPSTYSGAYRWRNLRLTDSAYFGGDGSTNSVGPTYDALGTGAKIRIFSSGAIYANTLSAGSGGSTGGAIIQNSSGYLKVSSSSRRFKENIVSIPKNGYLNATLKINPVNFNYINSDPEYTEPTVSGLIAEELDLIPEFKGVVNYDHEGLPASISYDRMNALLVLTIQEMNDKINNLQAQLDNLKK